MSMSTHEATLALLIRSEPDLARGMVAQYQFAPGRRWRFDMAWPARMVAVEVDGGEWVAHGGRHARASDYDKLNTAAILGWRVVRLRPSHLRNATATVSTIRALLEGTPTERMLL